MAGRYENRTKLLVSYDEFPEMTLCVEGIIPPRGPAVQGPRVAHYFGATTTEARGEPTRKRYETAYVLEWAHAITASLTVEYAVYNRVWVRNERCVGLLRKFVWFGDFVVDFVGQDIAVVSFKKLFSLLEKARELPPNFFESRVDYPSVTTVSWGVVRPGTSDFVAPSPRPITRRLATARSPLDFSVPDTVPRGVDVWETALSGEVSRGSGWPIREVLNILAGRVNRYHSLKEDAKVELDALRFEMESLASKNVTLREENSDLRRTVAADPALKRHRVNDGLGHGLGTRVSSRARLHVGPFRAS